MKNITKAALCVTTALSLTMGLTACGGTATGSGAPADKKIILKLADTLPVDDVQNKSLKALADEVRSKTNGSVDIRIYPSGQLGGELDAMQQISNGTLQMALDGSTNDAALDAFYTPYAFTSQSQLETVISSGKLAKYFTNYQQSRHATLVGWLTRSPREITSNIPVRTPADLQGLKIRTAQQESSILAFKALGANVTSLAFSEVFQALQSGAVSAQENPVDLIKSAKLNEVQKYLDMTDHVYAPFWIFINDATWNSMSASQQKAVQDSMADVHKSNATDVAAAAAQAAKDLQAKGMQVIQPDNAAFRNKVYASTVKPYLEKVWGADVVASLNLGN